MRALGYVAVWLLIQAGFLFGSIFSPATDVRLVLPQFANSLNIKNFAAARQFINPDFSGLLAESRQICENPEISKTIVQIFGLKLKTQNQVNGLLVLTTIDTLANKRSMAFQVTCEFTGRRWRLAESVDKISMHRNEIKLDVLPEKQKLAGEQTSMIEIPAQHARALALLLADGLTISEIRFGNAGEAKFRKVGTFENKNLWIIEWSGEKNWRTTSLMIQFNGNLLKYAGNAPINPRRCYLLDELVWHPFFFHNLRQSWQVPPENNFFQTLSISVPHNWEVVANGKPVQKSVTPLRNQAWFVFEMKGAIGHHFSGLNWVAAPNWTLREGSFRDGKTLKTFCYRTPDSPNKATEFHELTHKIISVYEKNYTQFPLSRCDVVEISDFPMQSRNCGSLILVEELDGQLDQKTISRLAREIARSWFGNTIRARGKGHAWLTDGFAAFSELLFWADSEPSCVAEMNQQMALRYFSNVDPKSDQAILKINPFSSSPRNEAIFQGKGGYVLHMLRDFVGAEVFQKILHDYFQGFTNREASVPEFIRICEAHSPKKLGGFFKQWLDRPGAPEFLFQYNIDQDKGEYKISGKIRQVPPKIYLAPVDIFIETRKGVIIKKIWVDSREVEFLHTTDSEPVAVAFDPQFKLLRHTEELDRIAYIQQSIRKGNTLIASEKFNEALKLFQLALAQDSAHAEILYCKGKVLMNLQQYHSAFLVFKKAAQYDEEKKWIEGWSYFRIGQIYDRLQLRNKAILHYQKALKCSDSYRLHTFARSQLRSLFFANSDDQ